MEKKGFFLAYRASGHCAYALYNKTLNTKLLRNIVLSFLYCGFESLQSFELTGETCAKSYPGKLAFSKADYENIKKWLLENNMSFGNLVNSLVSFVITKNKIYVSYAICRHSGMHPDVNISAQPGANPARISTSIKKDRQITGNCTKIQPEEESVKETILTENEPELFSIGAPVANNEVASISVAENRALLTGLFGGNIATGRRKKAI